MTTMDIVSIFIIYILLFRLSIVSCGIISIVLGYKLFSQGILTDSNVNQSSNIDAKISGSHFMLRNVAPGTCFGMFGVLVIIAMFAQGSPQLTLKNLKNMGLISQSLDLRGPKRAGSTSSFQYDNGGKNMDALVMQGLEFERKGDIESAIGSYKKAVDLAAVPMNHLSWLYQKEGKDKQGLPLAQIAVQLQPKNAEFLDTLAVIFCKIGKQEDALKIIKKASNLYPDKFLNRIDKIQSGACQ